MKIAVVGARSLIGHSFLGIISQRWNDAEVEVFNQNGGVEVSCGERVLVTKKLSDLNANDYDFIFSATDDEQTRELHAKVEKSRAVWIDKSSVMRMDENIPLIIPEVNGNEIGDNKIIASPNCIVIPVAMFLNTIAKFEIEYINLSTYQAISGAGKKAMEAFFKEIKMSYMKTLQHGLLYEDPMAFNIIPQIGELDENGIADEEKKIVQELHKILKTEYLITATCMRVPVSIGHTISLNFKLSRDVDIKKMIKNIEKNNIIYSNKSVTPIMAAREDAVYAHRLRKHANNVWSVIIVCDNLRKGGALNAVEIADRMKADRMEK